MESRIIHLMPPDPRWKSRFGSEKSLLESVLDGACSKIHHIGSTSIHGISAKPVVDILIEAESLEAIDARNGGMIRAGFQPKGENGIPRRRYFQKEDAGVRTVHVHAFAKGDIQIERHLAFRNGMNANPDLALEYEKEKRKAVELSGGVSSKYQEIKGAFIEELTQRFLESGFGSEKTAS